MLTSSIDVVFILSIKWSPMIGIPCVAAFSQGVNPRLDGKPLHFSGRLANFGCNFLTKSRCIEFISRCLITPSSLNLSVSTIISGVQVQFLYYTYPMASWNVMGGQIVAILEWHGSITFLWNDNLVYHFQSHLLVGLRPIQQGFIHDRVL